MRANHVVLFTVIVAFTVLTRLIPVLYTGYSFSNDVWILVRISEYLSENPSTPVYSLVEVFSYHVEYPASILESIVYSSITGLPIAEFYRHTGVVVLSLAMAFSVYSFAGLLAVNFKPRVLSVLALSLIPSFTIYTSSYLKEVYAHALIPLLLCVLLQPRELTVSRLLTVLVLSVAVVLSHPLASAVLSATLVSYLFIDYTGSLVSRKQRVRFDSTRILLLVPVLLFTTYSLFVTSPVAVSFKDTVILAVYALFTYSSYTLLGDVASGVLITIALAPALVALIYTVTAPVAPFLLALFVVPIGLLVAYKTGLEEVDKIRNACLLPVATLVLYVLTYMVEALSIIHRIANYVVYAFIPVCIGIGEKSRKVHYSLLLLLTLFTVTLSTLTALGGNPYTFYWRYGDYDFVLRELTIAVDHNVVIYGDPKYSYMVEEVKQVDYSVARDFCTTRGFLAVSRDNFLYGVPVTPLDYVRLPGNLDQCRSRVFDAGYVYVYS
ncbi:MAG: hypothetical protein QXE28_03680 [Desulfurococcaceae archaeon]